MTKEEILKEINNFKHQVNQRIADLENELKKPEEPKPWKPKYGERYYGIDSTMGVASGCTDSGFAPMHYRVGNCFPTEERANQVAEKIRMLLKLERYHDMFCPDYVPDWNYDTCKFFICYDIYNHEWICDWVSREKYPAQVYFDSEETAQKVCDLLNREENEIEL